MDTLLLDRFEVVEPLGSGGFGEVLRAFDTRMEREVAIKRLPRSPRTALRALREARTVALLNHPNIVTVYDFLEDDDAYYLVMEVVGGVPLSEILDAGPPLSVKEAAGIALQICHALECAHTEGVVHRDIKPQNMMLLPDGRVKVLDFGVAHLNDATTGTDTGIVGTFGYISPEATSGGSVDDRADIFSVGVLLYEMLCGANPFEADSPAATIHRLIHRDPPNPSEINTEVPETLGDAVMEALAKHPEERLGSAADLRARLERHVGPERPEGLVRYIVERHTVAPAPRPTLIETGRRALSQTITPWIAPAATGVLVFLLVAAVGSTVLPPANPWLWVVSALFGLGAVVRPDLALPAFLGALLLALAFYRWWLFPLAAPIAAGYYFLWRNQGLRSLIPFFSPLFANAGIGLAFPILQGIAARRIWAPLGAASAALILQAYDLFFSSNLRYLGEASPRLRVHLESTDFAGFAGLVRDFYASRPYALLEPLLWAGAALAVSFAAGRPFRHRALIFAAGLLALLYGYYFLSAYTASQPQVFWTILINWGTAALAVPALLVASQLLERYGIKTATVSANDTQGAKARRIETTSRNREET